MIYAIAALVGFFVAWGMTFDDAPVIWGALVGALGAALYQARLKLKEHLKDYAEFQKAVLAEVVLLRDRIKALESGLVTRDPSELRSSDSVTQPSAAYPPAAQSIAQSSTAQQPPSVAQHQQASQAPSSFTPPTQQSPPQQPTPQPAQQQEQVGASQLAAMQAAAGRAQRESVVKATQPSAFEQAMNAVVRYFSTGNTIAKIGMVILFIGVGFLVKYTSDRGLLPIQFRLAALALGSAVLSQIGWNLRHKRKTFAMILQGGGIGILYVTIFAAYRLYNLIPSTLALGLLVASTGLLVALSLLQNEMLLAVLATAGAFLAPVLASTGQGSHVALFSYFLLVNAGVLVISYFRSWRWLNVQGFLFTFILTGAWAATRFEPQHFASTEPFLIAFFAIYFAVGVLFARVSSDKTGLALDGTIIFGTPIAAFALQAKLVKGMSYGLAYSAAALAAVYIGAARFLQSKNPALYRFLVESFIALGVCFATLAIPFAVTGKWTAAVWVLEGAALVWVGLRQNRLLPFWSGIALQLVSGIIYVVSGSKFETVPFLNESYFGSLLLTVGYLASSYVIAKLAPMKLAKVGLDRRVLSYFFVAVGLYEWFRSGTFEFARLGLINEALVEATNSFELVFCAGTGFLFIAFANRLKWEELGFLRYVLGAWISSWIFFEALDNSYPKHYSWTLARIIAIAIVFAQAFKDQKLEMKWFARAGQIALPLIASSTWISTELSSILRKEVSMYTFWKALPLYIVPSIFASAILSRVPKWPNGENQKLLLKTAFPAFMVFLLFISTGMNLVSPGATTGIKYYPVLSAIDLAQILVFIVSVRALVLLNAWQYFTDRSRNRGFALLGVLTLIWLSSMVVRTIHHHFGAPWDIDSNFANVRVQMSLSILWSMTALALMFVSSKKGWRNPWIAGVAVLSLVVIKLVTVDLASRGTVERIVSFMGTGLILLVIGYLAPLPPNRASETEGKLK